MLFSSAECAHMYERRSIYFGTLAWVCADLKHTHAHARVRTHAHTLEKRKLTSPEIGLTYLSISLTLKAAGRTLPLLAQRLFHKPEFSKCITHHPERSLTHTHGKKKWIGT